MGGMAALGYMLQHPGSVRAHISVDTAPQAQPFAIAIRSLQREAIRLDRNWNEGRYTDDSYPERGMSIARKLGVITYRSAMEWNGRFARIRLDSEERPDGPFGFEFQVESYLQAHARKFVRHFDPNCYLYLSRASDWFDVAEYGDGSVHEGLKRICIEHALVIGVTTDILFPLEQQEQIAKGLEAAGARVEFVALDSPQGHDAFLVDIEHYGPAIGGFLDRLPRLTYRMAGRATPTPVSRRRTARRDPVRRSFLGRGRRLGVERRLGQPQHRDQRQERPAQHVHDVVEGHLEALPRDHVVEEIHHAVRMAGRAHLLQRLRSTPGCRA